MNEKKTTLMEKINKLEQIYQNDNVSYMLDFTNAIFELEQELNIDSLIQEFMSLFIVIINAKTKIEANNIEKYMKNESLEALNQIFDYLIENKKD